MKDFFLIAFLLLAVSCQPATNLISSNGTSTDVEGNVISHEMIVLGSQLEDPYSIKNMTKAVQSIYGTKADRVYLEPTDLYVRFLPKNDEEYNELVDKFGYQLIDHPVDYKIVKEGDYYHDPSIPINRMTWQYTVTPKVFPTTIEYEILDEVYIPDHDPDTKSSYLGEYDWAAIEKEAFILTGNEEMLMEQTKAGAVVEGMPEGRITIYDASKDEVSGLKGVLVSCNSFVKFSRTYTDEEGYYKMDKNFNSNPRYRIIYKNKYGAALGFNLLVTPATYCTLGKGTPQGLSLEIDEKSDRVLFSRSVVNNAVYDYYSMCSSEECTIAAPPANLRIWLFQNLESSSAAMMHHGVLMDEGLIKKYLKEYASILQFFLPDITLGLKGANSYSEIYTRAIHELSHASHFMSVGKTYWTTLSNFIMKSFVTSGLVVYGSGTEENSGYCEVAEMWAYYMQNKLYMERYQGAKVIFGTSYWFRPQIFLFLDERGLGRDKIFSALSEDVHDKAMLKKKLTSLNPQFKSAINTAFSRYN